MNLSTLMTLQEFCLQRRGSGSTQAYLLQIVNSKYDTGRPLTVVFNTEQERVNALRSLKVNNTSDYKGVDSCTTSVMALDRKRGSRTPYVLDNHLTELLIENNISALREVEKKIGHIAKLVAAQKVTVERIKRLESANIKYFDDMLAIQKTWWYKTAKFLRLI